MAVITGLPLELLTMIAAWAVPEDVEAFALSCTTFYNAAAPLLPDHNALRKRYRAFKYDRLFNPLTETQLARTPEMICSALELLLRAAENPIILRYIDIADLSKGVRDEEVAVTTLKRLQDEPRLKGQVLNLLSSPYVSALPKDPNEFLDMATAVYDVHRPPLGRKMTSLLDVFLLTLMPNVRVLAPPPGYCSFVEEPWANYGVMMMLLDRMLSQARAPSSPNPTALGKLKIVMPTYEPEYMEHPLLIDHQPYWTLPTVKKFHGAGLVASRDHNYLTSRRYGPPNEVLKTVWLEGCCLDDKNVREFLLSCGSIKSFRFSYAEKRNDSGSTWDAGEFVHAVEEATFDTLEELSISIAHAADSPGSGVVSLKCFKRLKRVEIETTMLAGPPYGGKHHIEWSRTLVGSPVRGAPEVPGLEDLLPDSVEDVNIIANEKYGGHFVLLDLFRHFSKDTKFRRLRNLKRLNVRVGRGYEGRLPVNHPRWPKMQEALKVFGGKLDLADQVAYAEF